MVRNSIAIIAGLVTSFIVIIFGEGIANGLNPLPVTIDTTNPEAIKMYIANAPAALHIAILTTYALACFTGGTVASVIASNKKITRAMTLGGILMGLGIYNLVSFSHPNWVIISGLFVFLPFAYIGGKVGINFSAKKK